jgi:hypothetical protein
MSNSAARRPALPRRRFLQGLGLATVGLTLAGCDALATAVPPAFPPLPAVEPEATGELVPHALNFFLTVHPHRPPTDDILVRRALLHAVDWRKAITVACEEQRDSRLMTTIITPQQPCHTPGNWPDWGYDPTRAKQELAQSSYASATRLGKIRIDSGGGYLPHPLPQAGLIGHRMAQIMAESWRVNLGIDDVEIQTRWSEQEIPGVNKINLRPLTAAAPFAAPAALILAHIAIYENPAYLDLRAPEWQRQAAEISVLARDDPDYCPAVQKFEAALLSQYLIAPLLWDHILARPPEA